MRETSTAPTPSRARQACDPCRRKKTRCPGEQPECSFCRRLNQRCTYGVRSDTASRIHKERGDRTNDQGQSQDRIHRLETQIEQIFDLLRTCSNMTDPSIETSASSLDRPPLDSNSRLSSPRPNQRPQMDPPLSHLTDSSASPWWDYLDDSMIASLIKIYIEKVHSQPLPLFDIDTLPHLVRTWPKYLLYSFIAVTARFELDPTNRNAHDRIESVTEAARQRVMQNVTVSASHLEVLQSLCLLSVADISLGKSFSTWINIGIAARIATAACFQPPTRPAATRVASASLARCYWSLFALDRMYGMKISMSQALPDTESGLDLLPSPAAPVNNRADDAREGAIQPGSTSALSPEDLGVNAYCMRLLSIWGHVMLLLQGIQQNEVGDLWLASSAYHKIVSELYAFETQLSQKHRFHNARFDERSELQLASDQEYWAPWLLMQFLFHTIQALINHPFLHLAKRHKNTAFLPPSFLQQTIDQTHLHCGWVLRLIDICMESPFEVHDPFAAHLVAVTATTCLFFFFAPNPELAAQSRVAFQKSCDFVDQMSRPWPHLISTKSKLDILYRSADQQQSTSTAAPVAQASLLWELFDYCSSTSLYHAADSQNGTVELNVTTQFLSPFDQSSTNSPSRPRQTHLQETEASNTAADNSEDNANANVMQDIYHSANLFDTYQMADFSTANLSAEFWSDFGHL